VAVTPDDAPDAAFDGKPFPLTMRTRMILSFNLAAAIFGLALIPVGERFAGELACVAAAAVFLIATAVQAVAGIWTTQLKHWMHKSARRDRGLTPRKLANRPFELRRNNRPEFVASEVGTAVESTPGQKGFGYRA